jgi:Uma2 family endonuclease
MASHLKHLYSPQEYVARERKALEKSEYYAGEIFAMAGASRQHNLIVGNTTTQLNNQLAEGGCEVYPGEMRVRTPDTRFYTYPDIVVACEPPQFEDSVFDTLLNPMLIIEVLSPSTQLYDQQRKFADYRRIESLKEYVLVAQDQCKVSRFVKESEELWVVTEWSDLNDKLILASIGYQLALSDIYRKVNLTSNNES